MRLAKKKKKGNPPFRKVQVMCQRQSSPGNFKKYKLVVRLTSYKLELLGELELDTCIPILGYWSFFIIE